MKILAISAYKMGISICERDEPIRKGRIYSLLCGVRIVLICLPAHTWIG